MKQIKSNSTNETELKEEMLTLSKQNPESWYTFSAIFGSVTITQHDKTPGSNYGEDCYRSFGGFFKDGKIVKPSARWMKQYNYIPCRD